MTEREKRLKCDPGKPGEAESDREQDLGFERDYLDEMQERSVMPQRGRSRARRSRRKGAAEKYSAAREAE